MTRQFRIECRGCPVADGQVLAPGFIPGERQMSEDEWTRLRCDTFEKSNKSCQNEPNYGLTPFRIWRTISRQGQSGLRTWDKNPKKVRRTE